MSGRERNFLQRLVNRANNTPDVRPRLAARFESRVGDLPVATEYASFTEPPRSASKLQAEREPRDESPEVDSAPIVPVDRAEALKTPPVPADVEFAALPEIRFERVPEQDASQEVAVEEAEENKDIRKSDTAVIHEESSPGLVERTTFVRSEVRERVRLRQELLTTLVQTEVLPGEAVAAAGVRTSAPAERHFSPKRSEPRSERQAKPLAPIEITIGHIEVRAAAERPAPPERSVRKPEAATSLGDYLKSREAR